MAGLPKKKVHFCRVYCGVFAFRGVSLIIGTLVALGRLRRIRILHLLRFGNNYRVLAISFLALSSVRQIIQRNAPYHLDGEKLLLLQAPKVGGGRRHFDGCTHSESDLRRVVLLKESVR